MRYWTGSIVAGSSLLLAVACGGDDEPDGEGSENAAEDSQGAGASEGGSGEQNGSGASASEGEDPCAQTLCGSQCVDVESDSSNCGECGTACSEYEACQDAACVQVSCPDALELCSGSCLDTSGDPDNCGACGAECDASFVCSSSACGCEAPRTECDGFCTVTSVDRKHCGACADDGGSVCADDEACLSGTCGTIAIPAETYCEPTKTWDAEWTAYEFEVLDWVNRYRAEGYDCDSEGYFEPVGPLQMQENLRCAARIHSLDMATSNYFDHDSQNGDSPWARIKKAGLEGGGGENIAAGQRSPESVVAGWMKSDGHCSNIMNPRFTTIGVGYAFDESSDYSRLWTQTFD